jgi:heme-degrading monooxygenase HmoA
MFILHVDLTVKPGVQQDLETVYREVFSPAISAQDGFCAAGLLRHDDVGNHYRLTLAFINREFQQHWVATDLHQEVWPQIESRCTGFSVNYYTAI